MLSGQRVHSFISGGLIVVAIRGLEAMSEVSIPETRIEALESTLQSKNSRNGELESQLASKNSEFNAVSVELVSTARCPHFVEDVTSFMQEQV